MFKYSLSDRKNNNVLTRGLSCDEGGVFIAGNVPLITRISGPEERPVYALRPNAEVTLLLSKAYGSGVDFSNHVEGLTRVAHHMSEGKWVLAKIAAVHLRLSEVVDDSLEELKSAQAELLSKCRLNCRPKRTAHRPCHAGKRDVSNEPRVPAGQTGGGEWTSDSSATGTSHNPLLVPAQAITAPMPVPAPFELPILPQDVAPAPFALPGAGLRPPPLINPYPNKRKCVEEWAEAEEFCSEMARKKKLVAGPPGRRTRGYSGFGKDYNSCVLGRVSEECGGNRRLKKGNWNVRRYD